MKLAHVVVLHLIASVGSASSRVELDLLLIWRHLRQLLLLLHHAVVRLLLVVGRLRAR